MGWETLGEVWDGSWDSRGGPGQVGRPSVKCGIGGGTLKEVRYGSGDLWGGLGRFV